MEKPRPYVTAALLCEKVLEEKNGTISVIRIADRLGYHATGMPQGMKPGVQISGLVCLKSGPVAGDHVIKIVLESPSAKRQEIYSLPVTLKGRDHGQNVILNMTFGIEQDGFYWFDVIFDDDVLTRIPLMVAQDPAPVQTKPTT